MTLRKISKEQPERFEFTQENLDEANRIIKKYPKGRQQSAVMSLLYLAQKQNDNWIPLSAMKHIGKIFVQVCTTTPCMIRGAYKLVEACKEKISENENEFVKEKNCSWMEVECLGACINAPMMQINDDYYEDLDKEKALKILDQIISGKKPEPGSYRGRLNSEPENNRKTLLDVKNA